MLQDQSAPVITLDGPTASGKGTVASRIANCLGWHVLDSGAIYRLAAYSVQKAGIDPLDLDAVEQVARNMQVLFKDGAVILDGEDVTDAIRHETVGNLASEIAKQQRLRDALLDRQRAFRQQPGLVADGRDMGTVVFPDAQVKIYLLADVQARAQRRYRQLCEKGVEVSYESVLQDLMARDDRDMNRKVAPLKPASDAFIVDSSNLSIDQTVQQVLDRWLQFKHKSGREKVGKTL